MQKKAVKTNAPRLLAEERRRVIVEMVEQSGQVTISEVAKNLAVSAVTARGDLDALAATGRV
ncbi:MAG: DeoR family transcriptional regulator, partial [Acidobacteriia bacterium]|nr:DeoR family transcriptional regulator [Terriglobia bacterium]